MRKGVDEDAVRALHIDAIDEGFKGAEVYLPSAAAIRLRAFGGDESPVVEVASGSCDLDRRVPARGIGR